MLDFSAEMLTSILLSSVEELLCLLIALQLLFSSD
jgi:hypothetical protein